MISAKMFSSEVLMSNFFRRVENPRGLSTNFKENYQRIHIGTCTRFFEPFYGPIVKCCNKNVRERMKMIEQANERFENELDIHLILKKMRAVDGIMKNLLTKS